MISNNYIWPKPTGYQHISKHFCTFYHRAFYKSIAWPLKINWMKNVLFFWSSNHCSYGNSSISNVWYNKLVFLFFYMLYIKVSFMQVSSDKWKCYICFLCHNMARFSKWQIVCHWVLYCFLHMCDCLYALRVMCECVCVYVFVHLVYERWKNKMACVFVTVCVTICVAYMTTCDIMF